MRYFWCELAIGSAFMITFAVEFNSLTIIHIRIMVNSKHLGLVNTRGMYATAINRGYAISAFNLNNMEQMQAIIKAAVETKSPVILQVSKEMCIRDSLCTQCSVYVTGNGGTFYFPYGNNYLYLYCHDWFR